MLHLALPAARLLHRLLLLEQRLLLQVLLLLRRIVLILRRLVCLLRLLRILRVLPCLAVALAHAAAALASVRVGIHMADRQAKIYMYLCIHVCDIHKSTCANMHIASRQIQNRTCVADEVWGLGFRVYGVGFVP